MADIPIGYTTHLNLGKWADGDAPGAIGLNNNLVKIDNYAYSLSQSLMAVSSSLKNINTTIYSGSGLQVLKLGVGVPTSSLYSLDVSGSQHISGSLYVDGDVHLKGYVTQDNFTEMTIQDHSIILNRSGSNVSAVGSGLIVEGDSFTTASSIIYDGTKWNYDKSVQVNADLFVSSSKKIILGEHQISRTDASYLFINNSLSVNSNLMAGSHFVKGNITFLNKAGDNWLNFAVRNTSGTNTLYDLSNIGSISMLRNANDWGWSIYSDANKFLTLSSGPSTNTKTSTWFSMKDNDGLATFTGNLIVSGTNANTFRGNLNVGGTGYNGTIYLKRSSDGNTNVSLTSISGSGFNIVQSGGRTSKYLMDGNGISFQTEDATSPYTVNTRMQILHGDSGSVYIVNKLGVGISTPGRTLHVNGQGQFEDYLYAGGLRLKGTDGQNTIYQSNQNTNLYLTAYGGNIGFGQVSATPSMIITSGGNVGIGTANPSAGKFVIINPSTSNQGAFIIDQTHTSAEILDLRKSGTSVVRVNNNGSIGIGTATTPEKLTLNGNMKIFGDIYSDNWNGVDPYTGFYIGRQGSVFNKITSNEMHVKSFIADLEMALAGSQIIAKSVAKLYSDFTVGGALIVEEISGFTGNVFENGDYIRLRNQSRTNGGINVVDIWGTVTFVSRDDTTKTQTYSFSKLAGSGTTATKGTLALDYGTSGNGIYETVAQGPLGKIPYSQVATFNTNPWTDMKIISRFGGLSGVTDNVLGSLSGYGLYTQKLYLSSMGNSTNAITMISDNNTARLSLQTGGNTVFDFNTATSTAKISNWTMDANKLYNSTDIVLDATNKKVSVNNDAVKMYHTSTGDYGIKDSAGKFQLGSTNQIAGWTFTNSTISKTNGNYSITLDSANNNMIIGYGQDMLVDGNYVLLGKVPTGQTFQGESGILSRDAYNNKNYFILTNSTRKIANWSFDETKLYNGSDIVLDATNKKVSVYSDTVKMYYTNTSDYGIKDSAGKFYLGSTNQIAGWTFDTGKLYNGTDIVLDATNKKVSIKNDTIKMYYTNASDYGLKDSSGYFSLGSVNQISGWTFDTSNLSKQSGTGKVFLSGNDTSVGLQIDLAYGSSGTAGVPKWLSAGKIRGTDGTSDYQPSYGFSIVDGDWNSLIELSDTRSVIANWTFDTTKLTSGTSTAGLSLNTSTTAFITSKGFEVYDTTNPKMFIGDKSGHFMDWNVSSANKLTIKGDLKSSRLSTTANYGGTDTGAFMYDTTIRSQYINGGVTYDCKMVDGRLNVYSNVNGTVTEVSIDGTDVTIGGYKAKRTLGSMTGAQISVLTGLRDGDEVFNTTLSKVQFWYGGAWR